MTTNEIDLEPAGARSWRVCDPSVARDDSRHVIAEVSGGPDGYVVTWLRGVHAHTRFDTLDDVLEEVHASRHRTRSTGPTRPIPIPHRPPPQQRRG